MGWLSRTIFYKLLGWRLSGEFPNLKKYIIIVVPHTSWHDFYIGLLVRNITGLKANFIGKKELFKPPFGWYFKWLGGSPVDRIGGKNYVGQLVDLFDKKEEFRLALAPEGTRKKVTQWRTGFYYIAKAAKVPIVMVAFDFGNKEVRIAQPFYPTNSMEEDFIYMGKFYDGVVGKIPEYSWQAPKTS